MPGICSPGLDARSGGVLIMLVVDSHEGANYGEECNEREIQEVRRELAEGRRPG